MEWIDILYVYYISLKRETDPKQTDNLEHSTVLQCRFSSQNGRLLLVQWAAPTMPATQNYSAQILKRNISFLTLPWVQCCVGNEAEPNMPGSLIGTIGCVK